MWEVVLSLHELRTRDSEVQLGPWRRYAVRSVPHGHIWRLLELSPPLGYFPDFLTPPGGDQSLGEELDLALSTPRPRLSAEIRRLAAPGRFRTGVRLTRWLRAVERGAAGTMAELERSVRTYHRAGLEPFWSTIRAAVSADRAARADQYAVGGLDRLLSSLHPRVRWRPPVLEVLDLYASDLHLDGRGLLLQPSYFCTDTPTKLSDPGDQPVLIYPINRPAEGLTLADPTAEHPAAALLGRTRAAALAATTKGCTTSELARHCDIAISTASQQATVLREGGLVQTRRDGGSVVHEITDLGRRILAGAVPPA
jgi:DNA-binding transcriptional ArsR family regulator